MAAVKVYEPCVRCGGQGWTIDPPSTQWTQPNISGPRMVCDVCHGTGKGKVKEIRDEQ